MSTTLNLFALLSLLSRGPYVWCACSLEPSGSRHAPDDSFDPSSQNEQITVTTGGASFGRVLHCHELKDLFSSIKNRLLHVYDSSRCNNVRE
jgi:hypothetical protein